MKNFTYSLYRPFFIVLIGAIFFLNTNIYAAEKRNDDSVEKTSLVLVNAGWEVTTCFWGGEWFNWTSDTNEFVSEKTNELIGFCVSAPVFFVEVIFNLIRLFIALALTVIGLIICVIGSLLIPVIFIWNLFF